MWDGEDGRVQVLTKTFVPKRKAITEGRRKFKNVKFIICTLRQIILIP